MKRRQNWEEAARATAEAEERARKRLLHFVRLKTRQLRLPPRQAERRKPFPWKQPRLGCGAQAEARDAADARQCLQRNVLSLWQRRRRQRWRVARHRQARETELRLPQTRPPRSPPMKLNKQKSLPRWLLLASPEAAQHNNWLQERVRELEDAEGSDAGARYGAELRRLREQLTADAAKAADELAAERSGQAQARSAAARSSW